MPVAGENDSAVTSESVALQNLLSVIGKASGSAPPAKPQPAKNAAPAAASTTMLSDDGEFNAGALR